jgi:hypothetical protein
VRQATLQMFENFIALKDDPPKLYAFYMRLTNDLKIKVWETFPEVHAILREQERLNHD